jgi:hypothetical protein
LVEFAIKVFANLSCPSAQIAVGGKSIVPKKEKKKHRQKERKKERK